MEEPAGSISMWMDMLGDAEDHRTDHRVALAGNTDCDVVIVGGGYTGLWTAYYLTDLDPSLRIILLERDVCGFGASGRNGGWAVGELAGSVDKYAQRSSVSEAVRQVRAMFDTVDEIGRVVDDEAIPCGFVRGGSVRLARNDAQAERQRREIAHDRELGFTEGEIRLLDADDARSMVGATDVRGGIFLSACAALDPARLVRGLADCIERRGVTIHEHTAVTDIGERVVETEDGTVHADFVIRATEAYTRDLPGQRRTLAPIYSLMIATEPLPDSVFDDIGLASRQTFCDDRYMVIYGQRTEDNRIAFGGRGVPYAFGSAIRPSLERDAAAHDAIAATLCELFPILTDARITHRWGGVLGAPRNWMPGVQFDREAGFGTAGGYVGEGVAAANLAGRTLADLVVGNDTERTTLPWVGVRSRRWEPEPLRWSGIRASGAALGLADRLENRSGREARWATMLSRVLRG